MRIGIIIAAAGSGTRLGSAGPKAFVTLAGRPLLAWSAATFHALRECVQIVVPAPDAHVDEARRILEPFGAQIVRGGARRQDSVWNALARIGPDVDVVGVHDAARPLVHAEDVLAACAGALKGGAAILARRVTDTLKDVEGDLIAGDADRERLWRAETPQAFVPALLAAAYAAWPGGLATDEAQIVTAAGTPVRVVGARFWNPKVTYPEDLALLERVLGAWKRR